MQDIKFRAWDTRLEEMKYIDPLHIGDYLCDPDNIMMQYIGTNDINGQDIYEGDIVECDQCQGLGGFVTGIVHFGNKGTEDWPDIRANLNTLPWSKNGIGSEHGIFHKNPRVLGNTYENPELIPI